MSVVGDDVVSVGEAARQLRVSPARVRELVHQGALSALRPGRELLIERQSLDHRIQVIKPSVGRPLSPRMAWAMLWVASGLRPEGISPPELVRARRYARRAPDQWPRLLVRRAVVHRGRMLPAQLRTLQDLPDIHRGGVSAALDYDLGLMASDQDELAELYVVAPILEQLRQSGKIRLGSANANVMVRVPSLDLRVLGGDLAGFMPSAVVAADLLEAGDERSIRAAHQLLDRQKAT